VGFDVHCSYPSTQPLGIPCGISDCAALRVRPRAGRLRNDTHVVSVTCVRALQANQGSKRPMHQHASAAPPPPNNTSRLRPNSDPFALVVGETPYQNSQYFDFETSKFPDFSESAETAASSTSEECVSATVEYVAGSPCEPYRTSYSDNLLSLINDAGMEASTSALGEIVVLTSACRCDLFGTQQ